VPAAVQRFLERTVGGEMGYKKKCKEQQAMKT